MPGTTDLGLRYPLDSDPVADGAQAVRNLAQDVNDYVGVFASGNASIAVTASPDGTDTITFPAGRFTAAPHVVCTARGDLYYARPGTTTEDDVVIKVIRRDGSSATTSVSVDWIAHQEA